MPKTKLSATLPDGTIATRTTARTYTHVVAVRRSYESALDVAVRQSAGDLDNYAHYAAFLDGTSRFLAKRSWQSDAEHAASCAWDIARATAAIDGATSADEYAAARKAQRIADVEARKAAGNFDTWSAEAWAGRLDLAQKAASPKPWFAEMRIVPVN